MKNIFLIIVVLFSVTGCATAKLSKGPGAYSVIQHENSAPVGVAKALDDRETEKAGTIGASTIKVKKNDLVELVSNYLLQYINEKIGLNVERVQISDADSVKLIAVKNKVDGVMILRIKELRMYSMDALLQPVEINLVMELTVFDDSGNEIYRRTVSGRHEKQIGITIVESGTGELVEAAIKNALSQYVNDSKLKKIIAKFKYGSVGSAIASIF